MTTETNFGRLERIKKEQWYVQLIDVGNNAIDLDDFNWLFEQAERANELDFQMDEKNRRIESLLNKQMYLRKHLEFYADTDNYEVWEDSNPETEYMFAVHMDGGQSARRVLEE